MIKHSSGVLESLENVKPAWAFLLPSVDPAAGGGKKGPLPLAFSKQVGESCWQKIRKTVCIVVPKYNGNRDWVSGWSCSQGHRDWDPW